MLTPLRCIIVDDEEGAHLVMSHYFKGISTLSLCASFYTAIEAIDYIYKNPVDVVFLDINMPGLTGMEMLEAMTHPPLIVLTTAYSQYALESYKYQVVDYLIKPIEFPRFLAAIDKVFSRYKPVLVQPKHNTSSLIHNFLILKVDGDILRILLEEIIYIQSWGNYVKVHTNDKTYLSPVTTIEIEQKLDKSHFMRIHKSHIVALNKIKKITGAQAYLDNGVILPIGNTFRRELLERYQQIFGF